MVFRQHVKTGVPRRRYVCRECGSWVTLTDAGQVYARFSRDSI